MTKEKKKLCEFVNGVIVPISNNIISMWNEGNREKNNCITRDNVQGKNGVGKIDVEKNSTTFGSKTF